MFLDRLLARNTRRKKNVVRGNYTFRSRRKRVRMDVRRLELNPETSASRREKRRKVMRWGFKFAVACLLLTGLVSVGKIVVRDAFLESPRFKLEHISVITDGALRPSEIIAAAGVEEGMNMLGIPLVQVRERL
jgi:cell division septal protein FtsQ